jgi:hypothetical protein
MVRSTIIQVPVHRDLLHGKYPKDSSKITAETMKTVELKSKLNSTWDKILGINK